MQVQLPGNKSFSHLETQNFYTWNPASGFLTYLRFQRFLTNLLEWISSFSKYFFLNSSISCSSKGTFKFKWMFSHLLYPGPSVIFLRVCSLQKFDFWDSDISLSLNSLPLNYVRWNSFSYCFLEKRTIYQTNFEPLVGRYHRLAPLSSNMPVERLSKSTPKYLT